jgi:hypothetical protein
MKITITDQVLSGNMGDGWTDQNEAAEGFAAYLTEAYRVDVLAAYPDAEIEIDVNTERNTSGYSRDIDVSIDPYDEDSFEIMESLTESLRNVSASAWESFCDGDGEEYFEED